MSDSYVAGSASIEIKVDDSKLDAGLKTAQDKGKRAFADIKASIDAIFAPLNRVADELAKNTSALDRLGKVGTAIVGGLKAQVQAVVAPAKAASDAVGDIGKNAARVDDSDAVKKLRAEMAAAQVTAAALEAELAMARAEIGAVGAAAATGMATAGQATAAATARVDRLETELAEARAEATRLGDEVRAGMTEAAAASATASQRVDGLQKELAETKAEAAAMSAKLTAELDKIRKSGERTRREIGLLGRGFANLKQIAAGYISFHGLRSLIQNTSAAIDRLDELNDTSARIEMPVAEITKWQLALQKAGGEQDRLIGSFEAFSQKSGAFLARAGRDGGFGKAIGALGITRDDLARAKSVEERMLLIADAISKVSDQSARAGILSKLGLSDLLPLLVRGRNGVDALTDSYDDMGQKTQEAADKAGPLRDRIDEVEARLTAASNSIYTNIGPALVYLYERLADLTEITGNGFGGLGKSLSMVQPGSPLLIKGLEKEIARVRNLRDQGLQIDEDYLREHEELLAKWISLSTQGRGTAAGALFQPKVVAPGPTPTSELGLADDPDIEQGLKRREQILRDLEGLASSVADEMVGLDSTLAGLGTTDFERTLPFSSTEITGAAMAAKALSGELRDLADLKAQAGAQGVDTGTLFGEAETAAALQYARQVGSIELAIRGLREASSGDPANSAAFQRMADVLSGLDVDGAVARRVIEDFGDASVAAREKFKRLADLISKGAFDQAGGADAAFEAQIETLLDLADASGLASEALALLYSMRPPPGMSGQAWAQQRAGIAREITQEALGSSRRPTTDAGVAERNGLAFKEEFREAGADALRDALDDITRGDFKSLGLNLAETVRQSLLDGLMKPIEARWDQLVERLWSEGFGDVIAGAAGRDDLAGGAGSDALGAATKQITDLGTGAGNAAARVGGDLVNSTLQSVMASGTEMTASASATAALYALAAAAQAAAANLASGGGGGILGSVLSLFGGGGGGGAASGIGNALMAAGTAGFASGGFTGSGDPKKIAGFVHLAEHVTDAAATRTIGPANLEWMRRNPRSAKALLEGHLPGFEKGGYVGSGFSAAALSSPIPSASIERPRDDRNAGRGRGMQVSIYAPGADPFQLQQVRRELRRLDATLEDRAVGAAVGAKHSGRLG